MKYIAILIALIAMVGMCAATPAHVAHKLPAPNVTAVSGVDVGMEDSIVSSAIPGVHSTGINTNQYYGGITNTGHEGQISANYQHGEHSAVWNSHNGQVWGGYTAWSNNQNYQQDYQYFIPALNQLVTLHDSDIHVVNGQAYDAEGHLLEYVPGGANLVDIDGQNPGSNPGLPTGNEDIATTVGDLCTQ